MTNFQLLLSLVAAILAAVLSSFIIWAIRPLMLRYALANPNARSSHSIPTPQGAGIAVVAATLIAGGAVIAIAGPVDMKIPITVFSATLFLAAVGFADDMNSIPILSRLLLQGLAIAGVIFIAPDDLRIVPAWPLWIERGLAVLAGLWFVNLVNFMDGLDLMTVAEAVPVSAAIVLLGWMGEMPASTMIVAAALCGALLGFSPFNRPVAKIFLGDVGSLPIGLLLGWCLLQLALRGQLTAALLLPLYYLLDTTATLFRRMVRREPFWAAHRSHFYQRATDNGFTVSRVVSEIFAVNLGLAFLAIASTMTASLGLRILLLAAGCISVAWIMFRFSRQHRY
jgi:UDP-N-acetylmuramyl pentapeptide phosphotransferase/UDP-N-acetylglucosamine-1-phosphate transferase